MLQAGGQQTFSFSSGRVGNMWRWISSAPTQQGLAQHPLVVDNAKRHCNLAEAKKVQTDGPPCEEKGWGFSPFALSTWGGLGTSA